jgi:Ankyrin repeats (3 copies)
MPLLNVAPATAEALVRRGAKMDIRHAAALGRIEAMKSMLAETIDPTMLEEALAYACIRAQREAAALLSKHGARGDVLVTPGGQTPRTALHEAANRGYLDIRQSLARERRQREYRRTALGWHTR